MSIDAAFAQFPVLTTARLRLRQAQLGDAEALFATFSDEEVMRYYGSLPHYSIADSRELIEAQRERYARRASIRWNITLAGEDRVIGSCGFHRFDEGYYRAELGYELNRTYWGQGIMSEAVSAVLTYGFAEMELHRIEAIIDDANARSKGLLLKLGFTYEGNLRERFYFNGHFEDEFFYGLLRDEWLGAK